MDNTGRSSLSEISDRSTPEPNGNISGVETTPGKKKKKVKIIRYGYEYLISFDFSSMARETQHTEIIVPRLAALVAAAAFSEILTTSVSAFLYCLLKEEDGIALRRCSADCILSAAPSPPGNGFAGSEHEMNKSQATAERRRRKASSSSSSPPPPCSESWIGEVRLFLLLPLAMS